MIYGSTYWHMERRDGQMDILVYKRLKKSHQENCGNPKP